MISALTARHRAEESRRFPNLIDKSVPANLDVHVIVDNSSAHKTPAIHCWLVRHPASASASRTYSSWLTLVERWFAKLTKRPSYDLAPPAMSPRFLRYARHVMAALSGSLMCSALIL